MKAAQRDEIAELRLAAVGPVLDVMPLGEARAIAAGEPAASIARFERPRDRRRNAARLAADVERLAVFAFDDTDDRPVAGKPAEVLPAVSSRCRTASAALSSALHTTAPISAGNRARKMNVPSLS